MNDIQIEHQIHQQMKPDVVWVLYTSSGQYYVEEMSVREHKGKYYTTTPKPITDKTVFELIDFYKDKKIEETKSLDSYGGIIPRNLIYYHNDTGSHHLIWYNPPQRKRIIHKETLGIEEGECWHPGLIFYWAGNLLKVFAYKDAEVTEKTKLFQAPYMNTSSDGSVCLGANRLNFSSRTFKSYMDAIENIWWFAPFTYERGSEMKGVDIEKFWKSHVKSNRKFPVSKMLDTKMILKDLLPKPKQEVHTIKDLLND